MNPDTRSEPQRAPGTGPDPVIRPIEAGDLDLLVRMHGELLPEGFFVSLGVPFMRTYYRTFIESPFAVALVAVDGGETAGAIVGTVHNNRHLAWVAGERRKMMMLAGLRGLVTHPLVAVRFVRTRLMRYVRRLLHLQSQGHAEASVGGDVAVLTHVYTSPLLRRRGLGRSLVQAFEAETTAGGATEARLVTRAEAGGAGAFYVGLGWERIASRQNREGVTIDEYRKLL